MDLPLLKDAQLKGKRVIVRIDTNVPIENGEVRDDFRLKYTIPTLSYLYERSERVILIGHHSSESQTLKPVAEYLNRTIKTSFVNDMFDEGQYTKKNTLYLCENLRFFKEETGNDLTFAKRIASLGDVYVNEAFSVSHRKHASVVSVPKFLPSYAGFLFEKEVAHLETAFHPPKPFLFILGGMKGSTKLPLAEKFLSIADHIFVGGAVVNNIFKWQGHEIGRSVVDEKLIDCRRLIKSKNVIVPRDVVVENQKGEKHVKDPFKISPDDKMLDAGPETLRHLVDLISRAAFIVFNGPLGDYEHGFEESTRALVNAFKKSPAETLVGGGDTIAAVLRFGTEDDFGFLSTGGGAMLDFLAHRTLPGIEALSDFT